MNEAIDKILAGLRSAESGVEESHRKLEMFWDEGTGRIQSPDLECMEESIKKIKIGLEECRDKILDFKKITNETIQTVEKNKKDN